MDPKRTASGFSSFVAGRQQFLYGDAGGAFADLTNALNGFVNFLLAPVNLGHDSGDTALLDEVEHGEIFPA
jgi:hypothetical protein